MSEDIVEPIVNSPEIISVNYKITSCVLIIIAVFTILYMYSNKKEEVKIVEKMVLKQSSNEEKVASISSLLSDKDTILNNSEFFQDLNRKLKKYVISNKAIIMANPKPCRCLKKNSEHHNHIDPIFEDKYSATTDSAVMNMPTKDQTLYYLKYITDHNLYQNMPMEFVDIPKYLH